jgi:NAD(P)-dependent dehydrogenase (short-subunit alcohol dehydrogenase family)
MRLQDKVAIVTGGGAGMGRAVALGFAGEGAAVVVADVDAARGEAAASAIRAAGGRGQFVAADITVEAEMARLVETTLAAFGRVDVLHNNAGIQLLSQDKRAHELDLASWERTLAVNLRGAWLACKYAIPPMLRQGRGSIILVGSPTGYLGCAPGYTAYSASKGGVIGLTRVLAIDYARDHIRVNSIMPGTMETPMIAELLTDPAVAERLARATPLGRIGQPEDIVGLAIFLASDEARFCTGGFYPADGGLTAI